MRARSVGAFLALFAAAHKPAALEIVVDVPLPIRMGEHLAGQGMQKKHTRAMLALACAPDRTGPERFSWTEGEPGVGFGDGQPRRLGE